MIFYEHHSLNSFEAANDACLMDSGVPSAQVLPYVSSNPPKLSNLGQFQGQISFVSTTFPIKRY